jgi:hypothetical protein
MAIGIGDPEELEVQGVDVEIGIDIGIGDPEELEVHGVDVEIGVEEAAVTQRGRRRKLPLTAREDPARADRQSMEKCMVIVRLASDYL